MANNRFQFKRTSTSGLLPNTTNSANNSYIAAGEFAVNLTDKKVVSSDGSAVFEVGANVINQTVTGTLSVNAISASGTLGTNGYVLTTNGTASYWAPAGSTSGLAAGDGLGSNTTHYFVRANTGIIANTTGTFVDPTYIATLDANNSTYLGGVNLTTLQSQITGNAATAYTNATVFASNASNINTGTLAVARLPANVVFWSNTNTFTANQTFNASAITSGNATSFFAAGTGAANGKINATAMAITVNATASAFVNSTAHATTNGTAYSNVTVAGFQSSAGSINIGNTAANVVVNTTQITVSTNATVFSSINSTSFSGTANNSTNLGGTSLSTLQTQITGNAATAYSNAVAVAASDATSKAATAYSNAVSVAAADATSKASTAYSNAVSDAASDASSKAATAYSNAVATAASDATTKAGTAYTNAVAFANAAVTNGAWVAANSTYSSNSGALGGTTLSTLQSQITGNAATAYTNAVAAAASDATTKAGTAYTNATVFASNASNINSGTLAFARLPANAVFWSNTNTFTAPQTFNANVTLAGNATAQLIVGTAANGVDVNSSAISVGNATVFTTINATSFSGTANNSTNLGGSSLATVQGQITGNAATAYTNAVAVAASDATTKAGTAYTNAVAVAASDATSKAATAYSNAVATAASDATTKAGTAYTNATVFASNASNINTGTLAAARLPYTMNQNVATNSSVEFTNIYLTGNLTVGSNVNVIGANNYSVTDNMIYLNANATYTNPDIGISAGYNDGTYAHTGFFRDHATGIWKVFDGYLPEPDASIYIDQTNSSFKTANFMANVYYVGNNTVYATVNSTVYSGTANNATNLGGSSLSTIQSQITGNAATAYTNAVAAASSDATTKAGTAYTNATTYASNATNISSGTLSAARLPTTIVNTSAAFTITGVHTHNANLVLAGNTTAQLIVGTATDGVDANSTVITVGNATVFTTVNSTAFSGTANNSTNLGGSSLATVQGQITGNAATAYTNAVAVAAADASSKAATAYSNAVANAAALYQTTAGLSANVATLTANAAGFLGNSSGTLANISSWVTGNSATAYSNAVAAAASDATTKAGTAYTNAIAIAANATNLTSGTVNPARLGSGTANSTTVLYGNGVWAAVAAGINTAAAYTWTNTQSFSNAGLTLDNGTASRVFVGNSVDSTSMGQYSFTSRGINNTFVTMSSTSVSIQGTTTNSGLTSSSLTFSNSTYYTQISPIGITQNVLGGGGFIKFSNTAANSTLNDTSLKFNANAAANSTFTPTVLSISNATATATVNTSVFQTTSGALFVGTTATTNAVVNTSGIFAYGNAINYVATTSANTTTIYGNSTVYTSINATSISGSGVKVDTAILGTGTANSTTVLYGNGVWAAVGGSVVSANTILSTGTGSNQSFVLSTSTATSNDLIVTVNGLRYSPNNYQVTGSTLYLTAPANSEIVIQLAGGPAGSVGPTGPSTNVDAAYTWTNVHTFNSNVVLSGNATSQLVIGGSTVQSQITGNAATAYSNATSYADTKAAAAYSNAVSNAAALYLPLTGGTLSGNLGIGTASTTQRFTLQGNQLIIPTSGWSAGQTAFSYLGDTNNGLKALNGGDLEAFSFNGFKITVNGATPITPVYVTTTGRVGIGTSNPGSELEVADTENDNDARVTVRPNSTTTSQFGGSSTLTLIDSSGTRSIVFYTNGTSRFLIDGTSGVLNSQPTYNNTAAGSTVVVTSTGAIRRTSSSIKYKKDVEDLDLSLASHAIDSLRPVWYRSKNPEGDDKATWSHIGLIAEEVHEVEPRLVRYRTAEVLTDEEGNRVERELEVPEPEDVDYARLSVLLLAEVKELRARVAALEAKV